MEEELLKQVLRETLLLMREYAVFARFGDMEGLQALDQMNVELRASISNFIEEGRTNHENRLQRGEVA